jgi:hypothetical protein
MKKVYLVGFLLAAVGLRADPVTQYNDRAAFEAALTAGFTVEEFLDSHHFPILSGILNSATNENTLNGGPILPGDIKSGVTYSTPVGGHNFFNIDGGGGFEGGFLDGFDAGRMLTVTFDAPVGAFGFDTNRLMSTFDVKITFSNSSVYLGHFSSDSDLPEFFGFIAGDETIVSAEIGGAVGTFGFALDNFTFGHVANSGPVNSVPDASGTALLLASGLGALALARRRLQR